MATIGVRDLRQNASKYLARVEAGEVLDVTNHGRLVARLVPVPGESQERQKLIAIGVLTPARRPHLIASGRPRPLRDRQRSASDTLAEMRDDQ